MIRPPGAKRWSVDWRGVVKALPPTPAISPSKANYSKRRSAA